MHTQTTKLVGAIGATAAFTAALTGGITAVHQYDENAASADTVAGFNEFQDRIAQAKAAAAQQSDHCKIHTGAFDELSYTPEPGESAHVSGSSFGLIGPSGAFNAVPADDGIAAYNCRWALTVKTNAVKYGIEGNELKDDVTVASDPTYGRDPWLVINHEMAPATVHGQAYYTKEKPTTKTYTIPAGAQLIGETDLDFNEPGTKTASIAKPATSLSNGYIVWVWSVDRQKQPGNWGKYMDANYLDGWGADDEVVTLPHQEEPAPTPTPTPGETTPAPINPTPGETTPAPAPSTPGDATPTPDETTPAPGVTTEAPIPGSQENGNKPGDGQGNGGATPKGTDQAGTTSPVGSTSVDHQGAALAHTGSTTLPLLGGAALLLAVGSGLALTKRRAIDA